MLAMERVLVPLSGGACIWKYTVDLEILGKEGKHNVRVCIRSVSASAYPEANWQMADSSVCDA